MNENLKCEDGLFEKQIMELLHQGKTDKEIMNRLKDPAVFQAFSPSRENILNWYPFKKEDVVLEVGAGMGAVTGLLCRKCERVVALEISSQHADICRVRHREYTNLEVVSESIDDFHTEERFDYVIAVGLLERAVDSPNAADQYVELLSSVRKKLKPTGVLLLAADNRFGARYWCGAQEDNTGIPFEGIAGYTHVKQSKHTNSGKAFDRQTLSDFIEKAGFTYSRYYYPMPDYQFCTVVFSDTILPKVKDVKRIKFSYSRKAMLIAEEQKVLQDIVRNDVFPFFANSFLIEASNTKLSENYIAYATQKRDYEEKYNIITRISNRNNIDIIASNHEARQHLNQIFDNYTELKARGIPIVEESMTAEGIAVHYENSPLASVKFQEYLREGDKKKCCWMIDQLREMILRSSDIFEGRNTIAETMNLPDVDMGVVLKHGFVDMTFGNCFLRQDSLVFFDQEWMEEYIPLSYILYRTIHRFIVPNQIFDERELLAYVNVDDKLVGIFAAYEVKWLNSLMEPRNLDRFDPLMYHKELTLAYQLERLNGEVERNNWELAEMGNQVQQLNIELAKVNIEKEKSNVLAREMVQELKDKLDEINFEKVANESWARELECEIDRIHNSRSWRLMQPIWKIRDKLFPAGSRRIVLERPTSRELCRSEKDSYADNNKQ